MDKIAVTLDTDLPILALPAGHVITYNDGLPTKDDGIAYLISQLAYLENTIYEAKYTNINYQELIPTVPGVPEWADTWDYIAYDGVTLGKFVGSSADDLPRADINTNKSTVPINYAGNSYGYTLDELRKSQQLNIPLDTTKARMTFRGAMEHSQRVAYFGDSSRNMTGLFNNPNIAIDQSTVDWDSASGQEIVDDMNQVFIDVWTDSANVHVPNVLVLDSTRFSQISSRRMDTGTDTTVLEFFMMNNLYTALTGQPPRVVPRLQLSAAQLAANGVSNGNRDRMLAYELNDENLGMANPIPWRSLAPQFKNLTVNIPCEYKISGTGFRYLACAKYRDSVAP